jgi:hypothetical protein
MRSAVFSLYFTAGPKLRRLERTEHRGEAVLIRRRSAANVQRAKLNRLCRTTYFGGRSLEKVARILGRK